MPMPAIDPAASRVETLTSALLYLMSSYQRSPCPHVALMVLRHMEAICAHGEAPPVLRQMCAGLCGEWAANACPARQAVKAKGHGNERIH